MSSTATTARDYDAVIARLHPSGTRDERMQAVVDALWEHLKDRGVSWVGFYIKSTDADEMILGPRRDKPACSPIAMFGACGQSFLSQRGLVVTNVSNLRAGYIACDPRDRSECVLPVFEGYGSPYGVLDLDSYDTHSFTRDDVFGLFKVLKHAGLTDPAWGCEFDSI